LTHVCLTLVPSRLHHLVRCHRAGQHGATLRCHRWRVGHWLAMLAWLLRDLLLLLL
jgi:hypothetical protein